MHSIHFARRKQSGFTIIELIVVIVILGILAAVAIPKFADYSQDARESVENATLGALKTAWSSAYAVKKGNPTLTEVLAQMSDPACSITTGAKFTCAGIFQKANSNALVIFKATSDTAPLTAASDISFDTP